MLFFGTLAQFLLTATGFISYRAPRIRWSTHTEFGVSSSLNIQSGQLDVPLDYSDPTSNRTLKLELLKVPAAIQPSKGSILFNFGGPGATARSTLALLAPVFQTFTGGHYDLVAFDPRGTGNTLPFSCVDNDLERFMFLNGMILSNSSDVALGRAWAQGEINAKLCLNKGNKSGGLIGTAFVARDLMSVVDALGEDGMLRYWGFSYGTTLGATVAAMFPDRIDKMILDGVQNPHEYYHAPADFEEWTDSDKVFSGIFHTCNLAGPDHCALARKNLTTSELEDAVWNLINQVKYHPIIVGEFLLDYAALKAVVVLSLYATIYWARLTTLLDLLLDGNTKDALPIIESFLAANDEENMNLPMALMGIHCGERKPRYSKFVDFLPVVDKLYLTSKIMGDITPWLSMTCAQWKIESKERYEGDFQVWTKNPVLLIGNTFDGLTPLRSAYNVSSGFKDSVVLEVGGYGHTSLSLSSSCAFKAVRKYWLDGMLPTPGTLCSVDSDPYSAVTWADIFLGSLDKELSSAGLEDYVLPRLWAPIRKGRML